MLHRQASLFFDNVIISKFGLIKPLLLLSFRSFEGLLALIIACFFQTIFFLLSRWLLKQIESHFKLRRGIQIL